MDASRESPDRRRELQREGVSVRLGASARAGVDAALRLVQGGAAPRSGDVVRAGADGSGSDAGGIGCPEEATVSLAERRKRAEINGVAVRVSRDADAKTTAAVIQALKAGR